LPQFGNCGDKGPDISSKIFFIIWFISKVLMKIIKIFNKKAAHKGLLFSKEDEIIYFIIFGNSTPIGVNYFYYYFPQLIAKLLQLYFKY